MRYWILVALLNGLFTLVIHFAAPEMFESPAYYAGVAICTLIAMVITWRDPPLGNVPFFLFKWGVLAAGLAFFVWGAGYRLAFWGEHNSDELVSSVFNTIFDTMMPNLAILTGILILCGVFLRIRNR
jgi:hypothetical protein